MLVHLLRHGETEGGARYCGVTDVALSARGWQQMRTAVAGLYWDLIVSSPLRRCATFAEALAGELGARLRCENDLREMSFGAWEGRSAAELMQTDAQRLRRFWRDPSDQSPPGGESLAQLERRVTGVWQRLVAQFAHERILIVTHGGPIRLLRAIELGIPLSALLSLEVPHAALLSIQSRSEPAASVSAPPVAAANPGT